MKTTLILGAGASIPYGFPSGSELKDSVPPTLEQIYRSLFNRDVRALTSTIENEIGLYSSIDQYLRDNTNYNDQIKLSILKRILHCESPNQITNGEHHKDIGRLNWYLYYFEKIIPNKETIANFEPMNIITFNYDRSLEYFLMKYLRLRLGLTDNESEAFEILHKKFNIIHVHGRLPNLPNEKYHKHVDSVQLPYGGGFDALCRIYQGSNFESNLIKTAKSSITTIYETKSEVDGTLQDIIKKSRRVVILGLGYLPENLKKIGFVENNTSFAGVRIVGTGFNLGKREVEAATMFGIGVTPDRDLDCMRFFVESEPVIHRG